MEDQTITVTGMTECLDCGMFFVTEEGKCEHVPHYVATFASGISITVGTSVMDGDDPLVTLDPIR